MRQQPESAISEAAINYVCILIFRTTMRFLCIVVDCYHAFDIFLQLYLSVAQLKVVLLSLPFDCMQESHRSCFHRSLAWLPPSVFYLVMYVSCFFSGPYPWML